MEEPLCPTISEEERLQELKSIRWNIALIALCGLLVTSPMTVLMNSTTSLLVDESLGITSLTASTITKFLGSAFLLAYINKILGMRNMVSITLMLPIAFSLSFFYPTWGTTFPAAVLMGLGMASLTSMLMYGNSLGYYYAYHTKGHPHTILVVISAFLTTFFGGGLLFGNAIYFGVLNIGLDDNITVNVNGNAYNICGAHYCNQDLTNMTTMREPEAFRYYTLVGIFAAMSILGGILSLFIRDFSKELECTRRKKAEYFTIMKETLELLGRPRGYLLILLTVFTGLEEAFKTSTYTLAYVSCTVGIPKLGLIMMAYGGTHIVVCLAHGLLVRIFGRIFLIIFGVCMVIGCCTTLLLWHPEPHQIGILFAVAVVWAASNASIFPSLFAIYGILFKDNIESSFSLISIWRALGFMLAFVWSKYFCVSLKLYITIAVGCAGLVCYILLEVIISKNACKPAVIPGT